MTFPKIASILALILVLDGRMNQGRERFDTELKSWATGTKVMANRPHSLGKPSERFQSDTELSQRFYLLKFLQRRRKPPESQSPKISEMGGL